MCTSAPPPADFQGLAQGQGQANLDAARVQSRLNNPSYYGPTGSQVTTWDGDSANVFQLLSPEQQALYDQGVGSASMMGQLAQQGLSGMSGVGGPLNFSGAPAAPGALNTASLPGMPTAFNAPTNLPGLGSGEEVRNRVIEAMMGRANTAFDQREDQTNSDLIARGLRPGTEAYAREMDTINRARNDARQQAEIAGGNAAEQAFGMDLSRRQQMQGEALDNSSLGYAQRMGMRQQATQEQGQAFDQGTGNRRQAITEALMQRQVPLSEIQTLLNGSRSANPFSQMPGFQGGTSVAPAPVYGAGTQQIGYDVDRYNAGVGQNNANVQAGTQLLTSFPWAELFSAWG